MPDWYTIRARVLPALLVALPLGLATLAWFPDGLSGWSALWGLAVWSGATVLLGQLGRDRGREKQSRLFDMWGAEPAVKALRHADAGNLVVLERIHKRLNALMRTKLPTAAQELADPSAADDAYAGCIRFLRDKTRDRKKFNLVFEENCNYGFRRNLWGLKPLGAVVTIIALASLAALVVIEPRILVAPGSRRVLIPGLLIFLNLIGWIFVVTPRWVRIPANAYVERLLEATERL